MRKRKEEVTADGTVPDDENSSRMGSGGEVDVRAGGDSSLRLLC